MTPRQREVLALIAAGRRPRDIARTLGIARRTVYALTQQIAVRVLAEQPATAGATARERVVAYCSMASAAA